MSVENLKARLRDIPGIENLTQQTLLGRLVFGWNGLIAGTDLNASDLEIENAIRATAGQRSAVATFGQFSIAPTPLPAVNITEGKTMTAPGSFASSIRAMMDEARAGIDQAKTEGLAKVGEAIGKLNDAKTATTKVATTMAKTIEDEASAVLSELGQISNDL